LLFASAHSPGPTEAKARAAVVGDAVVGVTIGLAVGMAVGLTVAIGVRLPVP